jgi:hypothetical protein
VDRCTHRQIQPRDAGVVSLVVVVVGIPEVETILVAEVKVISPRTRIVFHHASCVEEQITLSS